MSLERSMAPSADPIWVMRAPPGPSTAHNPGGAGLGPTEQEGGRLWTGVREVFGHDWLKILVILNPTG
jgi:hypothetical protein